MSTSLKRAAALLLCALPALSIAAGQEYHELYARECARAFDFYAESPFRGSVAARSSLSPEFLFAIVAPEITQYHHLRDVVEQTALLALYTHNGRDYADFSVGIFQMKPSFIEQIEEEIRNSGELRRHFPECVFPDEDTMPQRRDRLKRLLDPAWQTLYLMAFAEIMEVRFADMVGDDEGKITLWATAYNSGFRHSADHLEKTASRKLFPRFSKKKYNYAQLSLWFYDKLTNEKRDAPAE